MPHSVSAVKNFFHIFLIFFQKVRFPLKFLILEIHSKPAPKENFSQQETSLCALNALLST